jgi:adenylate cyclase
LKFRGNFKGTDEFADSVASRLISGEKAFAERYEMVTLVFVDIVEVISLKFHCSLFTLLEFTNLANTMTAEELMNVVNEVFSEYDKIATKFNVEPIKTIGNRVMEPTNTYTIIR